MFSSKTANHVKRSSHPDPDVRTRFRPKKKEKQHQREILKSRDTRQIHSKRRVDVDCQNRDSLKEDVCSCLACPKTFPRFLTIQEETRRCHSYFTRMTSRTSSESVSSCNRVSNATGFCQWIFVVHLIIIEQGCASCFPTFADSNVGSKVHFHSFLTRTIPSPHERDIQAWSDCLPTSSKC